MVTWTRLTAVKEEGDGQINKMLSNRTFRLVLVSVEERNEE
jgi:hypothetical protein